MRSKITFMLLLLAAFVMAQNPKREFRGAWIQSVNGQFQGMSRDAMQKTLSEQLDVLQQDGINAIFFQVRCEGDALYESRYEPWSRFLTGQQGQAPNPFWDPLAWMVEQCHLRNMECHAWINPFRAKTKATTTLANTHAYFSHRNHFFDYDGLLLFDPGIPENRNFICEVIKDIVKRYDVDGIHMDDYFYPYPVAGVAIPDDASYQAYSKGGDRGDWRRENVNKFMEQACKAIRSVKPWVKFGVAPFGIYRNQRTDPNGSATTGLQNYDDLYADVLKWVEKGWVDYNIPQIYWEIGNKAADYETLIRWWSQHAGQRPLYVGQDVMRTIKHTDPNNPHAHQMGAKYALQRSLPGIYGSCQWYAKAVVDDEGNYGSFLRQYYHNTIALQPLCPWIDSKAPKKVRKCKTVWTTDGPILFWSAPRGRKEMDKARQYVVYRFTEDQPVDFKDSKNIYCITQNTFLNLEYKGGETRYVYYVTALDRLQNESKPVKKKVSL